MSWSARSRISNLPAFGPPRPQSRGVLLVMTFVFRGSTVGQQTSEFPISRPSHHPVAGCGKLVSNLADFQFTGPHLIPPARAGVGHRQQTSYRPAMPHFKSKNYAIPPSWCVSRTLRTNRRQPVDLLLGPLLRHGHQQAVGQLGIPAAQRHAGENVLLQGLFDQRRPPSGP